MKLFRKLPGYQREPHGLEWALIKRLPHALLVVTAIPAITAWSMRLTEYDATGEDVAKFLKTVDIVLIAATVTAWTALLTIAIGCFVVIVMKGPAYVADAYHLHDAERP
jgi:Cu/Ag efflux pump CusA